MNYLRAGVSRFWRRSGKQTFRFLHDLQFMDSRGSELVRRAGSRSILTCGRADMVDNGDDAAARRRGTFFGFLLS